PAASRVIFAAHGARTTIRERPRRHPVTREEAEAALTAAGVAGDDAFPLFEAAIACALQETPDRDPEPARALTAEAAERLKRRLAKESPEEALAETMCGDMRLNGDLMTYEDPANTDLIDLWERRRGLPVTLGLLYIEVARRCGLQVQGVDFPGHFLLRIETAEGPLALDPFSEGRVVLPSELTRRALCAQARPARSLRSPALARRRRRARGPGRAGRRAAGARPRPDPRRRRDHRRPRRPRAGAASAE